MPIQSSPPAFDGVPIVHQNGRHPKPRTTQGNGYFNGTVPDMNGTRTNSSGVKTDLQRIRNGFPDGPPSSKTSGAGGEAHLNGQNNPLQSNGSSTHTNHAKNGNGYSKNNPSSFYHSNGNGSNGSATLPEPAEPYDLVCVGFGPASLAIAIALRDRQSPARVLFLERQPKFAWHAGMLLPGSRMQISFVKDLATLRNPRSEFTFINYLHKKDRLVSFTNLGTFLPLREEYNDYMSWCASHFTDYVKYGEDAVSVSPADNSNNTKPVKCWEVLSRNISTGEESRFKTRHVIVAVGGTPNIPPVFKQNPLKIFHSSGYSVAVPKLLNDAGKPYKIAVVGGGQSSAEIFNDIHERYPNSKTSLIMKQSALRPSDDSPFVNEIFDPSHVNSVYELPPDLRKESIQQDRATNYGVVRLELIEHLYAKMYHQRLRNPDDAQWQHRIIPLREVLGVEENKLGELHLHLKNTRTGEIETTAGYDAIIVATGYLRNIHETILKPAKRLMESESCVVGRDYRVKFQDGAVSEDSGVWLQGCCEKTHGLSDTLLSILAVRSGEIVDSIFGKEEVCS